MNTLTTVNKYINQNNHNQQYAYILFRLFLHLRMTQDILKLMLRWIYVQSDPPYLATSILLFSPEFLPFGNIRSIKMNLYLTINIIFSSFLFLA